MKNNPLKQLEILGQSIWLDDIKKDLLLNGLNQLIIDYNLRGMTSNPSIFEKAIAESKDYDEDITRMSHEGKDVNKIYETLVQKDIKDAADKFLNIYLETDGQDGYISLEVNPHLAHDTNGTIEEARRLWKALDRPNVLIKVPATKEGLPAIEQLIGEGININITLLFSLSRYREVANAYIAGIKTLLTKDKAIAHVASFASFFLSRIDVLIDPIIEKQVAKNTDDFRHLHGQVAIASAEMAYHTYKELFNTDQFKRLAEKGARAQRLLWASTSTKNPDYSDIKYVEALIGPYTVNTLPLESIEAYLDHGDPKVRLGSDINKAKGLFQRLSKLGINMDQMMQQLEDEGVDKFTKSYDSLIKTLKIKSGKQ
jgi:transaldolase